MQEVERNGPAGLAERSPRYLEERLAFGRT